MRILKIAQDSRYLVGVMPKRFLNSVLNEERLSNPIE
jgi:hypothetical protein